MTNKQTAPTPKPGLHPRNPHRFRYDFPVLTETSPELKDFVQLSPRNEETIDFSNPQAVKALNRALLKHFYKLAFWDIPSDYLCPPIPGRADYIHYLADLLAESANNRIPRGSGIHVLDIGAGSSCIYPIIGKREYGWSFVASESDATALASAQKLIASNPGLGQSIECRLQKNDVQILAGVIKPGEVYDLTLCNPPFFRSAQEALAANQRKNRNLGNRPKAERNFGGQNHELWYPGGELAFVQKMISESRHFKQQCLWFTSLVSNQTLLPQFYQALRLAQVQDFKIIPMAQGQKTSRILIWSYLSAPDRARWAKQRFLS